MNDKPDGMAMKGVPRVDDWHMTDLLHAEQGRGDPFAAAIRATRMPMIITDPRRNDNPIVFANEAFLRLTGYDRAEVLGRNCRFLQGADSDRDVIHRIRETISKRQDVQVEIINYRKDGFPFWNSLFISPVTNDAGDLHFYFASQFDLTSQRSEIARINSEKARVERAVQERTTELQAALEAQKTLLHEVDHRVKNNLQMVSSLIAMQTRSMSDGRAKASLQSTLARIEALSTVHRRLYQSKDVGHFDVAEFLRDLVTDLVTGTGRTDVAVECQLDTVVIPADQATPIALMVNELVTNALKYAFGDPASAPREGRLFVSLRNVDEGFAMSVADDGPGMPILTSQSSFGTKLIAALARQLHAEIAWTNREPGTRVTITVPVSEQVGGPVVEPND